MVAFSMFYVRKVFVFFSILMTVFLSGSVVNAAEIKLTLHHFLNAKSSAHKNMIMPWVQRIEKASDGRVKIDVYPSMAMGGKPEQLPRQVRDGAVDMAWFANGYVAGLFPRTEVFELPGVHQGQAAATNKAMLEMFETYLSEEYDGLVPLLLQVHSGNALHMVHRNIRSPADLKGLKVRIPSRTGAWILESLGAVPVKTSIAEVPLALSRQVVEGALIPFEILPPLKIQQHISYHVEGPDGFRFGTSTFQIAMNQDRWNSLPADIQAIFREQSGLAWHEEVGQIWDETERQGREVALQAGNNHVKLSKAEWAVFENAMAPVIERWIEEVSANGIDGRKLYERAVATVKKYMK
jgi:TRAP-type C4-dicarboxylate transport system substrate-binding protein